MGATWYYALTAEPPYPGSAMDALVRHREEAPPEIRRIRPEITERAASVLRRLMAKKVEDRHPDAQALLKEMLSVGMHCRLLGRPGRVKALQRFLDYVQQHDQVWVCRRIDLARHWQQQHPAPTRSKPP